MKPTLAALAFLLLPAAIRAQPAVGFSNAEPKQVKLSQSSRLTLAIEGPAPMRGAVQLPEQLLTADANKNWRIRPDPRDGAVEVKPAGPGRERWQQVYRLDPYIEKELVGRPLRVTFNPVKVNGHPVTWDPVDVTVIRAGGKDAPLPEPHAVTPVEELPDRLPTPIPQTPWLLVALALATAFALAIPFVVVWLRSRRAAPVPPGEWARTALAKLEASGGTGGAIAERVAAILRKFVERRFAIPATKFTTAELSAATIEQGWPVEEAESLRALLDECDLAKFAGDAPDDDRCRRLISAAVDWVDNISRPRGPN